MLLSNHETNTSFAFLQTLITVFMMTNFRNRADNAYLGTVEDKIMGIGCVFASASVSLAMMFWTARLLLNKSMVLLG
ncbi:hypothetical protein [Noviherbaspirillum aerium]|uniref:hypothetical protein n=1 Tax=Noviherbaspirillum aerium TaxID=2588497 RepID=UPI00124BE1DE|nr:hypothetical protein [Noviherbaspirillum aerium]